MRKLLSVLSSTLQGGVRGGLLFVALLATTTLWAQDSQIGVIFQVGDLDYKITNDTLVPYTVEVTQQQWSNNYVGLTTATIPETVTYTYYDAFKQQEIEIICSVTSIGRSAFANCSSLTSVAIPNSVTTIGESAFANCSSLTSVAIPNSVTTIGESALSNCSSLASITIPNSVTSIGGWAFSGCSMLTSMVVESGNTIYDSRENCNAIIETETNILISGCKNTIIPNNVASIGQGAFYRCYPLISITIPNHVTSIGEYAFFKCSSLTSITIPNSVTSIGFMTFYDCSSLTSVTIGNSVTSIGDYAFYDCSGLTSITCEAETPPTVGEYAFDGVSESIPVYVPCGYIEAYQTGWYIFFNIRGISLYSIEISTSNSQMGFARVDYQSCDDVEISAEPNYGYHFVRWSDGNTDNPRSLELTKDTVLTAEFAQTVSGQCGDNLYWNYKNNTLTISGSGDMYDDCPWGFFAAEINDVVLPNAMTYIGSSAFYGCSSLTSVTIPESVTRIGGSAFYGCSSLTSVTIPNSVTSIGSSAFSECSSLTSVTIPNSVTSIGNGAFNGCKSLTSITIPNSVTSIESKVFYRCSSLTSITIPNSVTSIGYDAFSGCSGLTSITIPNSVTEIGSYAFRECEKLGTVILGEKIKEIGGHAFEECNKLYHIYCYAPEPPIAEESIFTNYNVNLYVPCNYLDNYKYDRVFGSFRYIQCIESEDVTTNDVVVNPGANDVTITWPTEGNADTYTIVIKKGNEVFCTLTFNANGQLLNIAFAPGRNGNHPVQYAEQAGNGYRFTVTGLEEGTHYTYNIDVKNATNNTIKSHSGEFTTMGDTTTAVEDVLQNSTNCQKIIHDNQLLILRDDKTYNIVGQIVE